MPHYVRLEKATETGTLVTIHAYVQWQQCDNDIDKKACGTVIYGLHLTRPVLEGFILGQT